MLSFIPQINNLKIIKSQVLKYIQSSSHDNNLLFYKVISRYDKNSYVDELYKKCIIETDKKLNPNEFTFDLSDQVIQISKLCSCKYHLYYFLPLL